MFFYRRPTGKTDDTAVGALEARLQERDQAHRKEMEALKEHYEDKLSEQVRRETDALNRERERAANERKLLVEAHEAAINNLKASHSEQLQRQQEVHEAAIQSLKENFSHQIAATAEQLKTVTADMLKQRQEEFSETSGRRITQILEPLQSSIGEMRKAVNENTTTHNDLGGRLDGQLQMLMQQTASAKESAERLATALKGGNKIQGTWGEKILTELLESLGLEEGKHFDTQVTLPNGTKPDVVFHLDNNRELVVDSKVSLKAFCDYLEAENEEQRQDALARHIQSIKNHITELANKDYSRHIQSPKSSVGYVIMFIPNTSALLLATANEKGLWRKAMEQNVYIADEQTLYAALRIIDLTWIQIEQAQNQEKVFALAGELLDRVEKFLNYYKEIGDSLDKAQKNYIQGEKKLREGGKSIPQTARKLEQLGARNPKSKGLIDRYLGDPND